MKTVKAFWQRAPGKRFFEHTMPELVRELGRIADALEGLLAKWASTELHRR
ncbi:MAG: hypothetical protein ACRELB_22140 [Polyangiaceae bacterium]